MKKRILIGLLAAAIAVSSAACSLDSISGGAGNTESSQSEVSSKEESSEQEKAESSETESEEETDSAESEAESETESKTEEQDADSPIFSYQIEINGKSLTVPFAYSELAELGYTLDPDKDEELNANTYTIGTYVHKTEDESLSVQFYNGSDEPKKLSECEICQIEVELDDGLDVTLPGGLKFDESLTPEMIIEAYGEPYFDNDTDDYHALDYSEGGFKDVQFMLYKEDNMKKYSNVKINRILD